MDTTDYPSLSRLAVLHVQLAADARRAKAIVESMMDSIERLLAAEAAQDWHSLVVATRELAKLDPNTGNDEIVRQARHVCEELRAPHKTRGQMPTHLPQLLAACRAVRPRPGAPRP